MVVFPDPLNPTMANQLCRLNFKANAVQHRPVLIIAEGDVLKGDFAFNGRQRIGLGTVDYCSV